MSTMAARLAAIASTRTVEPAPPASDGDAKRAVVPESVKSPDAKCAVVPAVPAEKRSVVPAAEEKRAVVLDAGALIHGSGLLAEAARCTYITTPAVLAEVRDAASRRHVAALELLDGIGVVSPSSASLARVAAAAAATGEAAVLSANDRGIVALALDLCAQRGIPTPLALPAPAAPPPPPVAPAASARAATAAAADDGWAVAGRKGRRRPEGHEAKFAAWGGGEGAEGEWITAANVDAVDSMGGDATAAAAAAAEHPDAADDDGEEEEGADGAEGGVELVSGDFAVQAVAVSLSLRVRGPAGGRVAAVRRWVQWCHACRRVEPDAARVFCQHCGSGDTLRRIQLGAAPPRAGARLRGTIFPLPAPRAGRAGRTSRAPILREDQLLNAGRPSAAAAARKAAGTAAAADAEDYVFAPVAKGGGGAHHVPCTAEQYRAAQRRAGGRRNEQRKRV